MGTARKTGGGEEPSGPRDFTGLGVIAKPCKPGCSRALIERAVEFDLLKRVE